MCPAHMHVLSCVQARQHTCRSHSLWHLCMASARSGRRATCFPCPTRHMGLALPGGPQPHVVVCGVWLVNISCPAFVQPSAPPLPTPCLFI